MDFTVKYKSDKSYGTGTTSGNYVASVKHKRGGIEVHFKFMVPPMSRTNQKESSSAIKSLTLCLTTNEALQLAAAIIAQAHHPNLSQQPAYWMPPAHMPILDPSYWSGLLTVKLVGSGSHVMITNSTEAHIGRIKFKIEYALNRKDSASIPRNPFSLDVVDLLPGTQKMIELSSSKSVLKPGPQSPRISSVEPVEVYGMRPTDYKK
jgi:hypothetical protein